MSYWAKHYIPETWAAREAAAQRESRKLLHKDERQYILPASQDEIRAMDEGNVPNVQDRDTDDNRNR